MSLTTSQHIEQTAANWLTRLDAEQCAEDAYPELTDWLAQSTLHRVAFLRLQAAWQETGRLRALHAPTPSRREQMLQAVATTRRQPQRKRKRRLLHAVAASLALLSAGAISWLWHTHTPIDFSEYRTAMGEVSTQALPDGSSVTLASNSHIELQQSHRARDVQLTQGEAIFDVAKDPTRPFTVSANGYRAVAVGTRFSVRRNATDLRVVVTEGTVRFDPPSTHGGSAASVLLPAGSVILAHDSGVLVRNLPLAEAQQLLDWKNGLLVFKDTPLSEIVAEFNRYNTQKLVITDADIGQLRMGGSFRWDNQEGFVRLLEAGFQVQSKVEPGQTLLYAP
jgi:transmembrane sensor